MTAWNTIDSAPADELVLTKIDDGRGERNVQRMTRRGHLWWIGRGKSAMYVYYVPTHWARTKPLTSRSGDHK